MLSGIMKIAILLMMITGCAVDSTAKAARQFEDAERFADQYSQQLREANFIWSEYPPEMIEISHD